MKLKKLVLVAMANMVVYILMVFDLSITNMITIYSLSTFSIIIEIINKEILNLV